MLFSSRVSWQERKGKKIIIRKEARDLFFTVELAFWSSTGPETEKMTGQRSLRKKTSYITVIAREQGLPDMPYVGWSRVGVTFILMTLITKNVKNRTYNHTKPGTWGATD